MKHMIAGVKIGAKLSCLTAGSQAIEALEDPGHFLCRAALADCAVLCLGTSSQAVTHM